MITSKYITKFISIIMAAAVLVCLSAMAFPQKVVQTMGGASVALQYESELFDHSEIIQIDIQMEEDAWNSMLSNAIAEEYVSCDVVINGLKLYQVGIRPKGNTSLSSIAMDPDTDRYSLKLEFDHYIEGQTCYGLDKLILNNNYADATNMKEALIYDMYQYLDADASLYNYAKISVNGTYWGIYLALEAIEDSFLLRNYGTEDGNLYKPENMDMGGAQNHDEEGFQLPESGKFQPPDGENFRFGDGEEFQPPDGEMFQFPGAEGFQPPDMKEMEVQEGERPHSPRGNFRPGKGFSMGSNGSDLNYTDDNLDSYSAIWEGEVTNTSEKDHRRVVTALKYIHEGTSLETYLDIDNILKYMAVHTFSVNMDSLSGAMTHNYYLYECDGRLNILPWDYNLSFGGMGMGMGANNASEIINDAIDTPFQGTDFFNALLENEEYLARYHKYLGQLADEYIFNGKFKETYSRIREQIDSLVESDPTAFYSYEEYETGAAMLYQTVFLRAKSIQGQLDGSIPSTDTGQRADSSSLVDSSMIDIDVMGSFNRGEPTPQNRQF